MSYKCNQPYSLQLKDGQWKCCKAGLGCVAPQRAPTLLDEIPGPGLADITGDDSLIPAATNEAREACRASGAKTCAFKQSVRDAVSSGSSAHAHRQPDLEVQTASAETTNEAAASGSTGQQDATMQQLIAASR